MTRRCSEGEGVVMTTTRRSSFMAKPSFQIKLTVIFMLMVTIVANLVGGLCYMFINEKLQAVLENYPDIFSDITTQDIAQFLIPKILLAETISLIAVFILSIIVTHTIAGPVYRLEKTIREIGRGDLSHYVRLRPHDELKELADALNYMTEGLSTKLLLLREETEKLQKKGVDVRPLLDILDEFTLPGDERKAETSAEGNEKADASEEGKADDGDENAKG